MDNKQKEQSRRRQQRYRDTQKRNDTVTQEQESLRVTNNAKGMTDVLTNEQYVIPKAKDFRGLPVDVQRSIMRISDSDEEVRSRTIIALDYQRQFPNNIHRGTGL